MCACAVAGHDGLGLERVDDGKRLQPVAGVADRVQAQHAVHIDHIARKQHVLLRQPHHHVTRRMAALAVFQFQNGAAKFQTGVLV